MHSSLPRPVIRLCLASVGLIACAPGGDGASRVRAPEPAAAAPGAAALAPVMQVAPSAPVLNDAPREDADLVRALREHYSKYEYRIAMRDGVHLYTVAYVPKPVLGASKPASYPVMFTRTPYGVGPYGVDTYPAMQNTRALRKLAPSSLFVRERYILVHQDVRGKMLSEGTFVDVRPVLSDLPQRAGAAMVIDEATDAFDSIDYLVKNLPNNNGRVGMWGISYPGFFAAQAAIHAHPALKAVSPQAPVTDWFDGDDFHHNGAFFLADSFDFYRNFGKPRPQPTTKSAWGLDRDNADVYEYFLGFGSAAQGSTAAMGPDNVFWNDLMNHGIRDAFWQARDPRPHYRNARPAMLTVGGVFDAEDAFGALATYRAFEQQSPGAENSLVLGPWRHGGWSRGDGDRLGDLAFGQKTSLTYREQVEFPFFERHLRGKSVPKTAEATVFETGTNEWQAYASWPPALMRPASVYFASSGALTASAPIAESAANYLADPAHPVPYRAEISPQIDADYMTADQRFASRRPDVLAYVTAPLQADLALAGPVDAELWITTSATDADFVVKLIDVYPDAAEDPEPNPRGIKMGGYQALIRGEVMRAKFREGLDRAVPLAPNTPTKIAFRLPDVAHAFRSGHRLMVQVQSSWFPLVDRNPQTFVDIYHAQPSDYRAATHTLLQGGAHASKLLLPVLRGAL